LNFILKRDFVMGSKHYFGGIDAGTTGVTVMLVREDGDVTGTAYREYPCRYPHPGWVEQDITLVWEKVCEASYEAINKSGVDPEGIISIGISSQRGTFVCVDDKIRPLHYSIVWNDTRATEQAKEISQDIGEDRYREITGMPVSGLWAASKILWLVQNEPRIVDDCHAIINGQEFLLHQLGAESLFSDPSSLTLNGMMDIEALDWSRDVVNSLGIPFDKLPPMTTPAHLEGRVSRGAAEKTGFAVGTPLCRGGGDQQCAAIGAGVVREGMAEITIGTAAMMVAHIDSRREDQNKRAYIGGHAIPHKWDMEGGAFATGACLRWWRDVYGGMEKRNSADLGIDVYDLLLLEASRSPVGSRGHIFFPFLNGQVTPTYDNTARGGTLGLTLAHDRPAMIRSVLEGTGYEMRMVVESLEEVLEKPFDLLRVTGGGAKSKLWLQIQSDIYGKPLETLRVSECTPFGAAILGAVGAGVFGSIDEAIDVLVKPGSLVEPDKDNHSIYNELFSIFCDAFYVLRERKIFERISKFQGSI
jgi:xylulokinase